MCRSVQAVLYTKKTALERQIVHGILREMHTCSREKVVPVFVEGHGHDAVGQVKGFLYPVTMMNVYVDVQNPRVVSVTHTRL